MGGQMPSELDPKTYAITAADQAIIDHYIEEILEHGDGDSGENTSNLVGALFVYEQGLEWNKARGREWSKAIQQDMLKAHPETMLDWLIEDRFEMLRESEASEGVKSTEQYLADLVAKDEKVQQALKAYKEAMAEAEVRILAEEAGDGE